MNMKSLIIALGIAVIIVVVVVVLVLGGGGASGDLELPIQVEGASNVGSISIVLNYDSEVLEAIAVDAGDLASNAMIEHNLSTPGRVRIGMIDSSGINGDGTVVTVQFNIIDEEGACSITLTDIEAADADTLVDAITRVSAGTFTAADGSLTSPVITFVH